MSKDQGSTSPTPHEKKVKESTSADEQGNQPEKTSKLVEHAERELRLAGVFDQDSDYGGMLGHATLELIKTFASQGHSGFSAAITIQLFGVLAKWELLSEPTDDPDEWMDVSESFGNEKMWQNKRGPSYFSQDGGKHWRNVDNDSAGTSKSHKEVANEKAKAQRKARRRDNKPGDKTV